MTPAELVITYIGAGSVNETARRLDRDKAAVSRWRTRKAGPNRVAGAVPQCLHAKIIKLSGGKITAEDLIGGRRR